MSLPYLPPEIKCLVAEHLAKADLKNLRCICKAWTSSATSLLFDTLYISPYDKDLEVFISIIHDPTLACSIKELVFDVSSVPELSYQDYFDELRREIRSFTGQPNERFPFYSSCRRLNQFVNDVTKKGGDSSLLLSRYSGEKLVVEGFHMWQQLAAQEQYNLRGGLHGVYSNELSAGLNRLPKPRSIEVDFETWVSNRLHSGTGYSYNRLDTLNPYDVLGVVHKGSPLSRSWNTWHLRPKRLDYDPENAEPGSLNIIIRALSVTNKQIKRFVCDTLFDGGF